MNAIATIESNPVAVLTDPKVYSEFYAQMKAEVEGFEPDLSTATGRKAIASLAYKVTRTKTAIDDAGKKLNEDARAQINAVDAQRRKIRDELDELALLARKPLNEWEASENTRKATCDAILNRIGLAGVMTYDDTPATVAERLEQTRTFRRGTSPTICWNRSSRSLTGSSFTKTDRAGESLTLPDRSAINFSIFSLSQPAPKSALSRSCIDSCKNRKWLPRWTPNAFSARRGRWLNFERTCGNALAKRITPMFTNSARSGISEYCTSEKYPCASLIEYQPIQGSLARPPIGP